MQLRSALSPSELAAGVAALALAVTMTTAGPAQAARTRPTRAGIFSISPASQELRGEPGIVLSPTVVGNSSPVALRVRTIPVLIHQTRSGAFRYSLSRSHQRAARRVLALSTTGFPLPAHSQRSVLERWKPHAGHHHAWAGVIFRGVAKHRGRRGAGVHDVDQLLGLDLMDLRGDAPARGRIPGLSVADAGAHRVALTLALRNVGGSFGTPSSLRMLVRGSHGRVVARVSPVPGIVLPGVTRAFVAQLGRRLPAGRYTAVGAATLDRRVVSRPLHFRIAPNGRLVAPSLVAEEVSARGRVGGRASVSISVRNQGTRPGTPRGTVSLYPLRGAAAGGAPVARAALTGAAVGAGRSARLRIALGRLHKGTYRVAVAYAAPFVATNPALVEFDARASTSSWLTAWRWVRSHIDLIVLALIAAAALAYAWRSGRSRTGMTDPHSPTAVALRTAARGASLPRPRRRGR